MRRFMVIAMCAAVAGCGTSKSEAPSAPATTEPTHGWVEKNKDVYSYVTAVSDNDKANGKADGDVIEFKFLGQNEAKEYVLAVIGSDGDVIGKQYCRNPCKIARDSAGVKHGTEGTVAGAAFADAISGQMGLPSGKP